MKTKYLVLSILAIIFSFVVFSQVRATAVNAQSPISDPITSPITYFKISGKVTLFTMFRFQARPIFKIEATSTASNQKFSTLTKSDGSYELSVANNQTYKVKPVFNGYTFMPIYKLVKVQNSNVVKVNFIAIPFVFPRFSR